jgi:predicted NAD/FAD-dependent oxidoreductase
LDVASDEVKATLLSNFAKIAHARELIPLHLDAHRWLYSATPRTLDQRVLFDDETGLVVCGDWLASGRVEGAFLSGVAAAECILSQSDMSSEK